MSIASTEQHDSDQPTSTIASGRSNAVPTDDAPAPVKKKKRRSTSHLKEVPQVLAERELFKKESERYAKGLDASRPFLKNELEKYGRDLLDQMNQPEKYLGFAMVLIGNFFWKRQFLALPFERRMLLLPHCLKHAEGCPADYDEFGLDCESCGACSIADYKVTAEKLGYKVLVAEGSPVVLKIIVSGYIDGILGVACLNVLEKAIDKVLIAGVPSYAVPLHSGDCKNTTLDESWIWEVLEKYEPLEEQKTSSYVPLMRAADRLFTENFDRLLPRTRSGSPEKAASPLGMTENVAFDWLANGGKRFRPFITLAAYDGAMGGAIQNGEEEPGSIPDAVGRVAMAIEAFHKASLVHDDIQDGDQYRYGRETLHREHGVGQAINIGDYLIGIGYRLIRSCREELGADVAVDILDRMSTAHIKLCDGQGAEMAWQASPTWDITPLDALQIYALKTSPAFEAALFAGLRMAGDIEPYEAMVGPFSRHVGVGFQILNDLKDWRGDVNNKLIAGQDAIALRPTVLLALALQTATAAQKDELEDILTGTEADSLRLNRLRLVFEECEVFEKAEALVEKSRARAEALADDVENDKVRQLLYFFIDTVLAPEGEPTPEDDPALVSLQLG
ncbi:MAG: polyprenyl synthetase family protein [Planctomycetaceae bacterium]